jgi:hypothetical protein
MSSADPPRPDDTAIDASALEHPRGTLAIMIVFGLLFGLGWLAMFIWRFLERGAPHH